MNMQICVFDSFYILSINNDPEITECIAPRRTEILFGEQVAPTFCRSIKSKNVMYMNLWKNILATMFMCVCAHAREC